MTWHSKYNVINENKANKQKTVHPTTTVDWLQNRCKVSRILGNKHSSSFHSQLMASNSKVSSQVYSSFARETLYSNIVICSVAG